MYDNLIKKMIFKINLLFILFSPTIYSQFNFVYNDSIVVMKDNDTISLPWVGGMNHPQFSTVDLDYDGIDELVAFEPGNHFIQVFKRKKVNGEVHYTHLFNGENYFPPDIRYRLQMYDYDNDGKKDIFTYAPGGIKVYRNIGNAIDGVSWKLVTPILQSERDGVGEDLYVTYNHIPALYDIDNDGDMDILAYSSALKIVEWHKNMSMETYGIPDSLLFKMEQPCWGLFAEMSSGNSIELNSVIGPCGDPGIKPFSGVTDKHIGGGSLTAIDINNSGLVDLLIGDMDYNNLTLVVNGGINPNDNAVMISVDDDFPSYDLPVNVSNFVTAYYEDIDMDGVKDLIASTTYPGYSDNTKGVWLYYNKGQNSLPIFEFNKEDFLQGDMIDNGTGSIPILVDVNNDGLTDLLVANNYNFREGMDNTSQINYYKNVGSINAPVFNLVNDNWNNFKNSGYPGRVAPAFGDLDGDGDLDMIIGIRNGKMFYYENSGGTGAMNFNIAQIPLKDNDGNDIKAHDNATPELFDLDGDGLLDLIIGQGEGGLLYYKNIGSSTMYSFELINSNLGQVELAPNEFVKAMGVPRFVKDQGVIYLFAGNETGTLNLYDHIEGNLAPGNAFNLVSSHYVGIDTKGSSAPAIGKMRIDNTYDLFMGTQLGGVWSYRPGDTTFLSLDKEEFDEQLTLKIYPNPNDGEFVISLSVEDGQVFEYRIIDYLGQEILRGKSNQSTIEVSTKDKMMKGIYFVEVFLQNQSSRLVRKLIIN